MVCERGDDPIVIVPSAGEEIAERRASLGLEFWSRLLERGLGVASGEESVLGGEDRSTLGPASDMRGRIRDLLVQSQDRRDAFETIRQLRQGDGRTYAAQSGTGCGCRLDDGGPRLAGSVVGTCLFRLAPSRRDLDSSTS